ncbi:PoNi-like cognate immunity protein [Maribacter sp.]|nr:PoNi-like cognate immunity protein [Maribacter sp.]
MNLREGLNTEEGYLEIIQQNNEFIDKRVKKIEGLKIDEKNGVQNYPKPNLEIINSAYETMFNYQLDNVYAFYSSGIELSEIKKSFLSLVSTASNTWKIEGGYVQMVTMLSIGTLLEIEEEDFNKLINLVERENVNDYLIDLLLRNRNADWQQTDQFLWNRPYKGTAEIVSLSKEDKVKALERLKKYLSDWYKSLDTKTHESKWNIHTGYWCWEAGALAKILELDDSSLENQQYYPYDMVHWKE